MSAGGTAGASAATDEAAPLCCFARAQVAMFWLKNRRAPMRPAGRRCAPVNAPQNARSPACVLIIRGVGEFWGECIKGQRARTCSVTLWSIILGDLHSRDLDENTDTFAAGSISNW